MAFSKKQKTKMISDYESWLGKSQAIFMLEYSKMTMKDIDAFRAKVRDTGSEAHIVKNTLMKLAMTNAGYKDVKKTEGTLLVGFAYSDAPALAKVFADASKNSEIFKLRGGYLDRGVDAWNRLKHWLTYRRFPLCAPHCLVLYRLPHPNSSVHWQNRLVRWLLLSKRILIRRPQLPDLTIFRIKKSII